MKKIYLLGSLTLLFCMIFSCQTLKVQETPVSAGPVGVYLVKTSIPNGGEIEFTLTINADGTGSTDSTMGKSEFSGAKIEGNNFAFDMTINAQGSDMALAFKGVVDGDNISGTIGAQGGEMVFSGQRK